MLKKSFILVLPFISSLAFANDDSVNNATLNPSSETSPPPHIIKAGTHTPAQNSLHQLYCDQIGGIDITDNTDVYLGENTLDATFCKVTDETKYNSMMAYSSAGSFNPDGSLLMSSRSAINDLAPSNGTWSAEAANATISMGVPWWVRGVGHFNDMVHNSVSINMNVPDFKCSASNSNSNFTGSGILTAQVTCAASLGRSSTQDIATACVNGSCVQATGWIFFR